MKLRDGFILHETDGEYILVATGDASEHFNGYIRVNKTAAFIIEQLIDGATREEIIQKFLEEYKVERSVVEADLDVIIEKLTKINALE